MKSARFIKFIALAYKVEEKTVAVYARFLREAGLMTTGARGVNAPDMLPIDAARMTIALLATDSPSKCVECVRRFGAMKLNKELSTDALPNALFPRQDLNLEQVLVRLFGSSYNDAAFLESSYVELNENAKRATIDFGEDRVAWFSDWSESDRSDRSEWTGIRRSRGVASEELMILWSVLRLDRYSGFILEGHPLNMAHSRNMSLHLFEQMTSMEAVERYIAEFDVDWLKGAD